MATFTVTYTMDPTGAFLQLAPDQATFTIGDGIDRIEIVNNAGSDITIEAIPITCSVFDKPGKLMNFKIKDGDTKGFDLRSDLAGAFLSDLDFVSLLWKAKSKSGAVDATPLIPRSLNHFQVMITQS